ncbi:MAG: type II toxin-antitoxin system VapC family toxin [Egibacteraceae bacterium]
MLVWLYAGEMRHIPMGARRRLEHDRLAISPMVALELAYLHEAGRLTVAGHELVAALAPALDLRTAVTPFAAVVQEAVGLSWTRDPFDRLITAQAAVEGTVLLTADESIRAHAPHALWE